MNRAPVTNDTSTRPKAATIALWIFQIALAAEFIANAGAGKLLGGEQTVQTFEDIGAGQWLRYATGILEIAGGIGLLIPRLSGLAALGLAGVMGGAVLSEILFLDGDVLIPLILLTSLALVAWFRRDRTLELTRRLRATRSPADD